MAEDTAVPVIPETQEGPPAPASADNGMVKLESFDGDQAGVESALGITPDTPPAPDATEPTSEVPGDGVSSPVGTKDRPLPTVHSGDPPGVQDRINIFTKVNRDQQREIETLKAQVGVLTQPPDESEAAAPPNLETFGDDTKGYVEAVARWGAKEELREQSVTRQEQVATAQAKAVTQHSASSWAADIAAVRAGHEDYVVVMEAAAKAEADTSAMAAMLEKTLPQIPKGAEVFYALAKDTPGELTRISTLLAMEQAAELVLASRALAVTATATETEPESTPPTTPTTPIGPIAPSGSPAPIVFNDNSSHEDFLRWRADQVGPP